MNNDKFNFILCMELFSANSEAEVTATLERYNLWDSPEYWHDFGDDENNFATIGNQQSNPDSALVEKIVNSVDAILMRECLTKGLSPESPDAPQNIPEALVRFFEIKSGKLSNMPVMQRARLSEDICVVCSGGKVTPCYSIIDKGEGQTPAAFPNTLLSLRKSNKLRIPFVQGKFNMGGTGVLQFCGTRNLQLVISKRCPHIPQHFNADADSDSFKWGFTVVRRQDPVGGMRSSKYTYLFLNQSVPCFEAESINILPGDYPNPTGQPLYWGTAIKLFDYNIGSSLRTNIQFDLYNRLSLLTPSIALPVRLVERREGFRGHSFETILSGLSVRLEEDKRDNLEPDFPSSIVFDIDGEQIHAAIFAFKQGQAEKYRKDEGVIFLINGQTHAHLSKAFFARKNVGMHYIADSLLVVVDCSSISGRSREDLFMNSRDRLRSGPLKSRIERELEGWIRDNPGLRALRERRQRELTQKRLEDNKPLRDVVESIIKRSPTLAKLFLHGQALSNPFNLKPTESSKIFTGQLHPSFFRLKEQHPENNPKLWPINVRTRVDFKTDACNDYFSRDADPGVFRLTINLFDADNFNLNLWNGTAHLHISPPRTASIGDTFKCSAIVEDIARATPFIEEFYVRMVNEIAQVPTPDGPRKPPAGDKDGKGNLNPDKLSLPNIIPVKIEEWAQHNFDKFSALKIRRNAEGGHDYYINVDNFYLLTEIKGKRNDSPEVLEAQFKYSMALVGMAILYDFESSPKEEEKEDYDVYGDIERFSRVISPVILPMIDTLADSNEGLAAVMLE